MTAPTATGDPSSLRASVLERLAVRDLDLAADRAEVRRLVAARRAARRALGVGTAAAVVLVLTAAIVWLGGEDPDELVADRDDATVTTQARPPRTTSSTTPAAAIAPVAPPSSTTTAPGVTSSTAPVAVAPATTLAPTTLPPIETGLRAEVRAVEPRVAAGDTAVVEVAWMRADHVGPAPVITIEWGDPAVAGAPLPPSPVDCAGPPRGAGDVAVVPFRYATTGVRTVRVTLDACRDGRPDGERVTVQTTLEVVAPVASDASLRAVVLTAPRATHGGLPLPALDEAAVELVPDGPGPTRDLAPRDPLLDQVSAVGPATVVMVGLDDVGTLRLGWPTSPCRSETTLPPPAPDGRPAVLELVTTC